MRVIVCGLNGLAPSELPSAAQVAGSWRQEPSVAADSVMLSTGEHPATPGCGGFLDVVAQAPQASRTTLGSIPAIRMGTRTLFLDAATGGSGQLAQALAAAAVEECRVVVATAGGTGDYGGRELVGRLAGPDCDVDADPVSALRAARRRIRGLDLVAAVESDTPLLGLDGLSARRRTIDSRGAQERERALGEFAHHMAGAAAAIAEADTLDGAQLPLVGTALDGPGGTALDGPGRRFGYGLMPGSGSGDGLAHGLAVLGGRILPAITITARLVAIEERIAGADLVVAVVPALDAHELTGGVVYLLASLSADQAIPLIVLTAADLAGRREWSTMGVSGVYVIDSHDRSALGRVVRTWSSI